MFVPWTVNGRLIAALKSEEDRLAKLTGFRIKFVEEGGTPLWRSFNTKLGGGVDCTREGCVTCAQPEDQKIDCFGRSIVYESSCTLCYPGGKVDKPGDGMITSSKGIYTWETNTATVDIATPCSTEAKE